MYTYIRVCNTNVDMFVPVNMYVPPRALPMCSLVIVTDGDPYP